MPPVKLGPIRSRNGGLRMSSRARGRRRSDRATSPQRPCGRVWRAPSGAGPRRHRRCARAPLEQPVGQRLGRSATAEHVVRAGKRPTSGSRVGACLRRRRIALRRATSGLDPANLLGSQHGLHCRGGATAAGVLCGRRAHGSGRRPSRGDARPPAPSWHRRCALRAADGPRARLVRTADGSGRRRDGRAGNDAERARERSAGRRAGWVDRAPCDPERGHRPPRAPRHVQGPRARALDPLLSLARHANAHVKISGVSAFSRRPFPHADSGPWVHRAVEEFGSQRTLWGSDFPWTYALSSGYGGTLASVLLALRELPPADLRNCLAATARRLYGLPVPGGQPT